MPAGPVSLRLENAPQHTRKEPGAQSSELADLDVMGRVFNIQRYSIYDGDGTRTVVFLKGCNLHCPWCCNPESISYDYQVMYSPERCTDCGLCVDVCPVDIHLMNKEKNEFGLLHEVDRSITCIGCRKCEEVCVGRALDIVGEDISVRQAMETIMKDYDTYFVSNGGVTVSGGEASLQIDFVCALMRECHRNGITTAIETQGTTPWHMFSQLVECTDQFLYDNKQIDCAAHEKVIGRHNRDVYSNLEKLAHVHNNIVVRMPIIRGFNDTYEHLDGTFRRVIDIVHSGGTGIVRIDLLPYHSYGEGKYGRLGLQYEIDNQTAKLTKEDLQKLEEFIKRYDFPIRILRH